MSINNVNNNASVVNVGRTTPITPGPQPASRSLPVVLATDQAAVPVVEQNKIQSEVALSLLGIPRSEVALGIFADVNTYDVNPSEWSMDPDNRTVIATGERDEHAGIPGSQGWGVRHLPEESGALVEAPADETAILTSKRFFRYQPGRVSSATFGIKTSSTNGDITERPAWHNPAIRKYGIFDKYDGYYWETRDTSQGDQFAVVRRTQSIMRYNPLPFGSGAGEQVEDHALGGKPSDVDRDFVGEYVRERELIQENRFTIIETVVGSEDPKFARDFHLILDSYLNDLKWGGDGHTHTNSTTYRTALNQQSAAVVTSLENFRDELQSLLTTNGHDAASSKIGTLSQILISYFTTGTLPDVSNADWGNRAKIDTIFSVYDKLLGYLVAETVDFEAAFGVDAETAALYTYKTLRDVKFVAAGYATDVQYGGNAATVYNAKNNYSNGQVLVAPSLVIPAYEYLGELIASPTQVTVTRSDGSTVNIDSVVDLFGLNETQRDKFQDLTDLMVDNFADDGNNEYEGVIDYGSAEQFGDILILRDGLIMTHSALYDPSLLLEREKAVARVYPDIDTIVTSGRSLVVGQYVNYYGDAAGLVNGKTYKVADVRGVKSNEIKLVDPMADDAEVVITSAGTGASYIETPVPFIFPGDYDEPYPGGVGNQYDGMFPYLYTQSGLLPADATDFIRGAIDTAIDTSANAADLKAQVDAVNLRFNGWVRDNVDPQYYSVYEFRVPRSRFSGDSLDGESRSAVYSDNVLDKRSGELYVEDGTALEQQSLWDFDFSKVTMLKIEFSWYGAVGALFLAYVPVGNGEARWVRVHHLRCSNQLKISSLGNATLPITYLVYGGGSETRMGPPNADRLPSDYSSYSENLVKYGASYYIDGGDRGTVRLYNHSSEVPTEMYGSRYTLTINDANAGFPYDPSAVVTGLNGAPAVSTYYINARVITGNSSDQNVKITWVDPATDTVYFNKAIASTSSIMVIVDRPDVMYGIKTKDVITSGDRVEVRNRVQVYPTRLSLGTSGNAAGKVSLLKTPLYQTPVATFGSLSTTADVDLIETNRIEVNDANYLQENGDAVYGYFRCVLNGSSSKISVLGKLEKLAGVYYFKPYDLFNGSLELVSGSTFLKEGLFDSQGSVAFAQETTFEKERLSSVEISQRGVTPIPGTGTEIASYYLSAGAQDIDLSSYFDYNKEYISYPLTDALETLYIVGTSSDANSSTPLVSLSASLTWEEQ